MKSARVGNRGLAFKLVFFILTCTSLVLGALLGYDYIVSRQMILKNIKTSAQSLARETAQKIETVLHSIKEVPETLAQGLEEIPYDEELLKRLLRSAVENNSGIYGSTIAFEPKAFDPAAEYFAPYAYRSGRDIKLSWLGGSDYHYFMLDWYQVPKELGRLSWTEPYYDEGGGNILMSTCSVPFYRRSENARRFMGVVTADVSLAWLQEMVAAIKIARTGYAFLISKNGTFITHPRKELIMNETLFSLAEERQDAHVRAIGREMIRGRSGFVPFISVLGEKKCWMAYVPVPSTGWSVAVVFPQDELMADVARLNMTNILLAVGGFGILLIVIILVSSSITRPLEDLARAAKDIAQGNWEVALPDLKSNDEVGVLVASFRSMKEALKKYIHELTRTTAAKERMEGELKIAHDIQMNFVPKTFPPFPGRKEFELYAVLEPAREVGGGLFDYFFTDESHLCFAIGDVSGKGVPAALYMAMTKVLLKANAKGAGGPDEILSRVNAEIALENDSCFFITVFCGILNTETGEIVYANGGHNAPLVLCRGQGARFLSGAHGPALGVIRDAVFSRETLTLAPGDTLYLYTDGVTEACDENEQLFSDDRLQKFLSGDPGMSLKGLIRKTLREIRSFTGTMPQSDDITALAVKYLGGPAARKNNSGRTLALASNLSDLPRITPFLSEAAERYAFAAGRIHDLSLVLEEIVVNIISYAYEDASGHEIIVDLEKENGKLIVRIYDDGKPFDPLQVPPPDLDVPLEKRPIGGLGVHIVRSLTESADYQRQNGWNVLTLRVAD